MEQKKPEQQKKDQPGTAGDCSTGGGMGNKTGSCGSSTETKKQDTGSCGSGGKSDKGSCH
jgi:hypothetical protein